MKYLKPYTFYAGFLGAIVGSPYLAHGLSKMAQGQARFFLFALLVFAVFAFCCAAGWILSLKGSAYERTKPFWERPLAFLLLVIFSPLILLCAILIKLESEGPVIYQQQRVAKNRRRADRRKLVSVRAPGPVDRRKRERRASDVGGRIFEIYKLRSMRVDSEELSGAAWSTGDADPRVTKVGYFIRKTHFDELPQLLNVFLGQMSIIGPRPERPAFISELREIIEGYQDRLSVSGGITGLAQVSQEHDETIEDVKKKLKYDREYVGNMSLWLDLKIILLTIGLVLRLILNSLKRETRPQAQPKPVSSLIPGGVEMPDQWESLLAEEKTSL